MAGKPCGAWGVGDLEGAEVEGQTYLHGDIVGISIVIVGI